MFSLKIPTMRTIPLMHKGPRFVLGAVLLLAVLVGCQSNTGMQNECKAEGGPNTNKAACRKEQEGRRTKASKRFSNQFKVDPHAGHKAIERVAIVAPTKLTEKKGQDDDGGIIGDELEATTRDTVGQKKEERKRDSARETTAEPIIEIKGKKGAAKKREPVRLVSFSIKNPDHKFRQYTHSVISPSLHAPRSTRYEEKPGDPRVRTGSIQFDALFSLALNELRASHLSRTSDSDYQNGKSEGCLCFGDKNGSHFLSVQTLALSGYLGLSTLNTERMENALLFQLSPYRDGLTQPKAVSGKGNGLQIIQRAGKYGSWPVYSDRVLWALAAEKTQNSLGEDERIKFSKIAYRALKNTIEIDRVSIFDGADGLYRGAYLDAFSHVNFIANVSELANAKNLVVNLSYYQALKFAANLAQFQNDIVSSVKYSDWAVDLKHAINQKFWAEDAGVYRSQYSASYISNSDHKVEWWLNALAINLGVAGNREKDIFMSRRGRFDDINSPLHAALSLQAAAKMKHVGLANIAYRRLIDNVSTEMSNQKVFESIGRNTQEYSNNANLLSVSAYASMVIDTLFGVKVSKRGLRFEPFITKALRASQFKGQRSISLMDIRLQQKKFAIKIIFPKREGKAENVGAYYSIRAVEVNGENVLGEVSWARLNSSNKIVITLGRVMKSRETGMEGGRGTGTGTGTGREGGREKKSLRSLGYGTEISMSDARVHIQTRGNRLKGTGALLYLSDWGAPDDRLRIEKLKIKDAGFYKIQLQYRNPAPDSSGIANAVKWVMVHDHNGNEYGAKIIEMPLTPMTKGKQRWQYSLPVTLHLNPGTYQIRLEDFLNMSYLKVNMTYNGKGGHRGPSNRVDIKTIRIEPLR